MHRLTLVYLAIALSFATPPALIGADAEKQAGAKHIDDLIRHLADAEFAKRESACNELEAIGEPALERLQRAAASHEDLEIRQRAAKLVRAIGIAGLIGQLAHAQFAKREAACKELEATGEPALAALRKAAASNVDLEIRQRAARLVRVIEARR